MTAFCWYRALALDTNCLRGPWTSPISLTRSLRMFAHRKLRLAQASLSDRE